MGQTIRSGKRAKRARHTLGVLNANWQYMYIIYNMEVRMSPLPVARAPYCVKEAALGHSNF